MQHLIMKEYLRLEISDQEIQLEFAWERWSIQRPFLIQFDIPVKDEERLHYGLDMYRINDLHWKQQSTGDGSDVNNVIIYDDISCGTLRDIKRGEERTCLYNHI